MPESFFKRQVIPLTLTAVVCGVLVLLLWAEIIILNQFTSVDIKAQVLFVDVLIGLTIYLKTSIDFAIFIGGLMHEYPGWKNRVAIEIGTAVGNAAGTMIVLAVWTFFKEVEFLLAIMIFLAALVLFRLAEEGLPHIESMERGYPKWFRDFSLLLRHALGFVNRIVEPFLSRIVPNPKTREAAKKTFLSLFMFSLTIPFILGLDDFAGYVPIFSIVNVFGFAIGAFLGHMFLNIFLYVSPDATIKIVKNPIVAVVGSIVFIGLGAAGLYEVAKIIVS